MWWKKKSSTQGISPRSCRGTRLVSYVDAAGFPFGAVIDRAHSQASMGLVFEESMIPSRMLHSTESKLGEIDSLVGTMCVESAGSQPAPARLWATFRARSKSQRKDDEEFVAELAKRSTQLYNAAEDCGLHATPLTDRQITQLASYAWSEVQPPQWPPVAKTVVETAGGISIDQVGHVALEVVTGDDEVEQQILEVMHTIQVGPRVSLARSYRPAVEAGRTGRRAGIVTLSMDSGVEDADRVAESIMSALDPRVQLRVHRLWGRTEVGVATMCGGGVLGWQHTDLGKVVA